MRASFDRFDRTVQRGLWVVLLLLGWTVLWELSGWDVPVMVIWGTEAGFKWQHNWWLETVLHDRARGVMVGVYLLLVGLSTWPVGGIGRVPRWQRWTALVGVTLALLAVNWVKRNSGTSCPWDIAAYGGQYPYVSHLNVAVLDGGPGRCFPGGHASAVLAFWALAPAVWRTPGANARWGWWVWGGVLGLGLLFGLVQTVRGAHYPSHTAWTMVICWGVAWLTDGVSNLIRSRVVGCTRSWVSPPNHTG